MANATYWHGPVKAEPNFDNLLKVLRRQVPSRPTLFEFYLNEGLYRKLAGPDFVARMEGRPEGYQAVIVQAFRNAGYDYATVSANDFGFPTGERHRDSTVSLNEGSVIKDRASFDCYRWPDPDAFGYDRLKFLAEFLPTGMKLIVPGPCGVLENVISLVGFDNLCYLLADDPDLVQEIVDAVGSRLVRYYQRCVSYDTVGAIIGNDDWGFKTSTMLSAAAMRKFIFPWHKRIVETAHAVGKPVILHSCGNLSGVMDDIIDGMKYDAKHSYEDCIEPVEKAYTHWGPRIAIVGGIDVDVMVRATPAAIHQRALGLLALSAKRGGYALGTGNSVPPYIPDENFFAMISAAVGGR